MRKERLNYEQVGVDRNHYHCSAGDFAVLDARGYLDMSKRPVAETWEPDGGYAVEGL